MMKGTFVPYGFVLAPIGASLVVLFSVFVFTNGLLELLLGSAASFAFGLGMLEAFGVYPIIGTARAPSVQATRIVMRIGYLLLAIQFVFLLVPETTHRAFSVQIPFSQSLEWIGLGTLLLSGYLLGGATWVVWDRWRQTSAVVLEIPTWTRPSLQSWVLVLGFAFRHAGVYPQLDSSIRFSSPLLRWSGVAPCRNPSTKDEGGSAGPNDGYFHHDRIEKNGVCGEIFPRQACL